MKQILFVLMVVFHLYSCSTTDEAKDCVKPIGELLFSATRIEWGEIFLQKEYTHIVKIYNPTKKNIIFSFCNDIPDIQVSNVAGLSKDGCFVLPSNVCDTFIFTFSPCDTLLLGTFHKGIHIKINDEILITPLEMIATILENFDTLGPEFKLGYPAIEVVRDTFDFGDISKEKKVYVSFFIKNIGTRNLIIRKVETYCDCTNAVLGQYVLKPGESTNLEATFRSLGRTGLQYRTIKLYCNDPKRSVVKFTIKGYVKE